MEIEYDLSDAHPDFVTQIPEIVGPLALRYPTAVLRRVGLYQLVPGDASMGRASPDGAVEFNPFWFGRDPRFLAEAAKDHPVVDVGGISMAWHGPMVDEPAHVVTHEFAHCVWYGLPPERASNWADARWLAATRDPSLAPTGYALANAVEYFAELFALVELGHGTQLDWTEVWDLVNG